MSSAHIASTQSRLYAIHFACARIRRRTLGSGPSVQPDRNRLQIENENNYRRALNAIWLADIDFGRQFLPLRARWSAARRWQVGGVFPFVCPGFAHDTKSINCCLPLPFLFRTTVSALVIYILPAPRFVGECGGALFFRATWVAHTIVCARAISSHRTQCSCSTAYISWHVWLCEQILNFLLQNVLEHVLRVANAQMQCFVRLHFHFKHFLLLKASAAPSLLRKAKGKWIV